jgi:UDP-N-acetylglucosamine--N-acetylmuramyl-(pentapeptide) pyrophosphoryl-undecaprenol N-acetylglucosamine transferase
VTGALPRLVERVRVIHVTGVAGYAGAMAARADLPEDLRDRYRPFPFLHEDMTAALAAADLAVGRAGASTLAEAAAFALPTAIVPYPHAAGHQRLNAEAFADAGAAILIEDEAFDADRLVEVSGLLADPARHAVMSAAAREVARPDAAVAVADLVMAVASRAPLPTGAEIDAVARGSRP